MNWGHKVISKDGPVDATRTEFNAAFGVESPDRPDIPDAGFHVWEWWWLLNARRIPSSDSMAPITYTEIHHWFTLTNTLVTPPEIRMLIQMDDAYLQSVAIERKEQRERNKES